MQARGAAGPRGTPGSQASHAHLDDGLWGRPHRSSSKVPAMCTRHARSRCGHRTGICVLRVGLASAGLSGVEHPAPPTRPLASQTRRPRRPGTQARCTFGARKQTRCACSSCGNCQRGWEGGLAWAGARRDWDPLPPLDHLGAPLRDARRQLETPGQPARPGPAFQQTLARSKSPILSTQRSISSQDHTRVWKSSCARPWWHWAGGRWLAPRAGPGMWVACRPCDAGRGDLAAWAQNPYPGNG